MRKPDVQRLIKAAKKIEAKYNASEEHSRRLQEYADLARKGKLVGDKRKEYEEYKRSSPNVYDFSDEIKEIVAALNNTRW